MHFTTLLAFATTATAGVIQQREQAQALCAPDSSPLCCALDILDLANIDCHPPAETPLDVDGLIEACADEGQQAKCCKLPILGHGLLCSDVHPMAEPDSDDEEEAEAAMETPSGVAAPEGVAAATGVAVPEGVAAATGVAVPEGVAAATGVATPASPALY